MALPADSPCLGFKNKALIQYAPVYITNSTCVKKCWREHLSTKLIGTNLIKKVEQIGHRRKKMIVSVVWCLYLPLLHPCLVVPSFIFP